MTPHINAKLNDIAEIVLMPGDPKRAEFIAMKYLKDAKLVNDIRNMFMFTGTYHGIKITIAGSGMGCPSIGIYSYELYKFYNVNTIIRVGSAGSYISELKVFDLVNVSEAFGESNYAKIAANIDSNVIKPGKEIFDCINQTAKDLKFNIRNSKTHASDVFYRFENSLEFAKQNKLECVEMESYALFANAIHLKKQAATILTISDSFVDNQVTTPNERQNSFVHMIELALESAVNFVKK